MEQSNGYVSYEYKEVAAPEKAVSMLLDGYESFGWTQDPRHPAAGGGERVVLHLRRSRKLVNRMELTRLQRNFECSLEEIGRLERTKTRAALFWALLVGLAGTAFMAGAVFAVTAQPPRYLLMAVLAVPGFAGWAAPCLLYRRILQAESRRVQPLIEEKYEEIFQLCEKGHALL